MCSNVSSLSCYRKNIQCYISGHNQAEKGLAHHMFSLNIGPNDDCFYVIITIQRSQLPWTQFSLCSVMCGGNKHIFRLPSACCQEPEINTELLVFHGNLKVLNKAGKKVQLAQRAPLNHRGDAGGDAEMANQLSSTEGHTLEGASKCWVHATKPNGRWTPATRSVNAEVSSLQAPHVGQLP